MSSETELVNLALTNLGKDPITSIDEATSTAATVKSVLRVVRRAILEDQYWFFAREFASLPADATAPENPEFTARYKLPSDFVRLWYKSEQEDYPHVIQGSFLETDAGAPLNLVYVKDVPQLERWPEQVGMVFAASLAVNTCMRLTGSRRLREDMVLWLREVMPVARHNNALNTTTEEFDADIWLRSRRQGI